MRALVLSQCEQKGYAFCEIYERYIFDNTNALFSCISNSNCLGTAYKTAYHTVINTQQCTNLNLMCELLD